MNVAMCHSFIKEALSVANDIETGTLVPGKDELWVWEPTPGNTLACRLAPCCTIGHVAYRMGKLGELFQGFNFANYGLLGLPVSFINVFGDRMTRILDANDSLDGEVRQRVLVEELRGLADVMRQELNL
jgi:hypothetical protein